LIRKYEAREKLTGFQILGEGRFILNRKYEAKEIFVGFQILRHV